MATGPAGTVARRGNSAPRSGDEAARDGERGNMLSPSQGVLYFDDGVGAEEQQRPHRRP